MQLTPKIFNRASTVAITCCLIVATRSLTFGCTYVKTVFVTDPQGCASETNSLFDTSWVLVVLVSAAGITIITLYAVLDAGGLCVGQMCNNQRSAITLSVLTAVFAGVYANFVLKKLGDVPDTIVDHPRACFVCPNGKSQGWRALLVAGPTAAVMSIFVTSALHCHFHEQKSVADDHTEMLIRANDNHTTAEHSSTNILLTEVN